MMDPIGFALEPFDAVGHARTVDQSGQPIDAKDVMYDGTPVDGPAGVRTFVLKYKDQYVQNVDGESHDVRARARHGVRRHADRAQHRAHLGARRLQAEDDHRGDYGERRVPDERRAGR